VSVCVTKCPAAACAGEPTRCRFAARRMLRDLQLRRWRRDLAERARWTQTCSAPRKPLRKPNQSFCAPGANERTPPKALRISQPHCLFIDETPLLIDHQRDGKSTRCVLRGTLNGEICSAFRSDHNRRLVAAAMASAKHRGKEYEQSKQGN
jgi:hypothetical protein